MGSSTEKPLNFNVHMMDCTMNPKDKILAGNHKKVSGKEALKIIETEGIVIQVEAGNKEQYIAERTAKDEMTH